MFDMDMVTELKELPNSDRENIIQQLNNAIADNEQKLIIHLNYFRSGKNLCVLKPEFMDLYNVFKRV